MNVTVENLAPCKKLVRFEVDATVVDEAFATVTKEFLRRASLPGFRAGKAPLELVLRKHEKDIEAEVKRKLISESYRQGIKDQKLSVVGYPDIEEIQFGPTLALQFAATVETAPEFELPQYRGLAATRESSLVSEQDIDRAIAALQSQQAAFEKVERPVATGDFAVVNYQATTEGKPLTEFAPTARGLTEQANFWIEVKPDSFIPGFSEQLIGAEAGAKRTVTVTFPADFGTPQLAGKIAVYEVELIEVKRRALPELNDAFAQAYGAENLERLREGVRKDLQNEQNFRQKKNIRNKVVEDLLAKVNFDLPESHLKQETRNVVFDIVSENKKRGITKDLIDENKEQIYSAASQSARDRVKAAYLFQRIAEKEGIRVTAPEIDARVVLMARAYEMPPQKFLKELQSRDGLPEVHQQLLHEKVIDLLQENAKIQDAAPTPAPAS